MPLSASQILKSVLQRLQIELGEARDDGYRNGVEFALDRLGQAAAPYLGACATGAELPPCQNRHDAAEACRAVRLLLTAQAGAMPAGAPGRSMLPAALGHLQEAEGFLGGRPLGPAGRRRWERQEAGAIVDAEFEVVPEGQGS